MKHFSCVVENPIGIHARPAALIASFCVGLKSSVKITCNGKTASGSDVLQILSLEAKKGDVLEVTIEGSDENEQLDKLKQLVCNDCIEESEAGILKVAFFGTKDYDRMFFSKLEEEKGPGTYNVEINYLESRLTPETVALAKGHDAVCIFVNDENIIFML